MNNCSLQICSRPSLLLSPQNCPAILLTSVKKKFFSSVCFTEAQHTSVGSEGIVFPLMMFAFQIYMTLQWINTIFILNSYPYLVSDKASFQHKDVGLKYSHLYGSTRTQSTNKQPLHHPASHVSSVQTKLVVLRNATCSCFHGNGRVCALLRNHRP